MSNKNLRQAKIKEIISTRDISSQEELGDELKRQGHETTQATLSRDLHEIGIVRVPSERGFKYVFHQEDTAHNLRQLIGMEIVNILFNESTVVIKTMPGRAQGVAIYLDRIKDSHIIGTVAGDDSIVIIPDSHNNIPILLQKVRAIME
ncbi:MAG: arginine repressor [Calditrichaceae bacterium]